MINFFLLVALDRCKDFLAVVAHGVSTSSKWLILLSVGVQLGLLIREILENECAACKLIFWTLIGRIVSLCLLLVCLINFFPLCYRFYELLSVEHTSFLHHFALLFAVLHR